MACRLPGLASGCNLEEAPLRLTARIRPSGEKSKSVSSLSSAAISLTLAPTQTVPRAEQRGALEHLEGVGLRNHALQLRRKGPLLPMATVADNIVASLKGLGSPDPPARVQQGLRIPETRDRPRCS